MRNIQKHIFIGKNLLKKILNNKRYIVFFALVLILKIILSSLFSSDYPNQLFIPFLNHYLLNLTRNPYIDLYSNGVVSFPYPPLMLWIFMIPEVAISYLNIQATFLVNLIFKLPLILFDLILFVALLNLYPKNFKYVSILYFLSPIVIYASFMHGQLDLIPTSLFLLSLVFIDKEKTIVIASVILGLALSTKLHLLAALPLIIIYVFKNYGIKKALLVIIIPMIILIGLSLPYLSTEYIYSVLLNPEQSLLTQISITFVNLKLYIPIVVIVMVYIIFFSLKSINRDMLFSFLGILFSVFLIFVPPMPAWYIWIVPFITIFFIQINKEKYETLTIYFFFNFIYLFYFIFLHQTELIDLSLLNWSFDIFKINNYVLQNITFTVLNALLLYIIYQIYKLGLQSNQLYKRRNLPFTIGIAGDSASGKSTLIDILTVILGKRKMLFIEGDGDHKWERGETSWKEFTHLNPKSNYLYRQAEDIKALRNGDKTMRVDYDHESGKFTESRIIRPKPFIILNGLHSLYLPQTRRILDLKIFMEPEEKLRRYWKIQRDVGERGYSFEKIIQQIETRLHDASLYIQPQREFADLIISYFDNDINENDLAYQPTLNLKFSLSSEIDISPLVTICLDYEIDCEYEFNEGPDRQIIRIWGEQLHHGDLDINALVESYIPNYREISKEYFQLDNNVNKLTAFVLLYLISYKMKEVD